MFFKPHDDYDMIHGEEVKPIMNYNDHEVTVRNQNIIERSQSILLYFGFLLYMLDIEVG